MGECAGPQGWWWLGPVFLSPRLWKFKVTVLRAPFPPQLRPWFVFWETAFSLKFLLFFFLSPHVHFPTEFSQYPFPVCLWGGHILLRYLFPILLGNCLGVLLPFTPTHTHPLICIAPFYCFLSSQDYLIPFYVQVTFFRGAFWVETGFSLTFAIVFPSVAHQLPPPVSRCVCRNRNDTKEEEGKKNPR